MKVEIYRSVEWFDFLVRIENDVFEMNHEPMAPNGVNMYVGSWGEWKDHCKGHKLARNAEIPVGIAEAIVRRTEQNIAVC